MTLEECRELSKGIQFRVQEMEEETAIRQNRINSDRMILDVLLSKLNSLERYIRENEFPQLATEVLDAKEKSEDISF